MLLCSDWEKIDRIYQEYRSLARQLHRQQNALWADGYYRMALDLCEALIVHHRNKWATAQRYEVSVRIWLLPTERCGTVRGLACCADR